MIKIKVLYICSRNLKRSLTAEKIFHGVNNHAVRSAGTENNARVKITEGMIGWADLIFVMEKKHLRRIKEKFSNRLQNKKIICLNIPDEYNFMDRELILILEESFYELL